MVVFEELVTRSLAPELFEELVEHWREAYDPARVSWQTDSLYHVEHARRALKQAREREAAVARQHRRYEDEARQRAVAAQIAREERAAYWASPEGQAEEARREAERIEERQREHDEDLARRRHRLPVWAEWAAWRAVVGRWTHTVIGEKLGGVAGSVVGQALLDYVYLNHPDVSWENYGYRRDLLGGVARRRWLKRHFRDRVEPPFPGRVVRIEDPLPRDPRTPAEFRARNEWVYRQRLAGRTLRDIAGSLGLCPYRINQICWKEAEIDRKRKENWLKLKPWRASQNRGRPIDIDAADGCGGPRDIWLTYMPPVDPRLDNMEPVQPSTVRA